MVGHNVNRCVDSLRLNSDSDFKHLMSYGRAFQYFGATTDKADSEKAEIVERCTIIIYC